MAMVPHERSLVTRMQGKPFALLGVNCDTTRLRQKEVEQKHQMTWRSWFDGRLTGAIYKLYRSDGLPSVYVIDAKGIIRYRDLEGPSLDAAVDKLLEERGQLGS